VAEMTVTDKGYSYMRVWTFSGARATNKIQPTAPYGPTALPALALATPAKNYVSVCMEKHMQPAPH